MFWFHCSFSCRCPVLVGLLHWDHGEVEERRWIWLHISSLHGPGQNTHRTLMFLSNIWFDFNRLLLRQHFTNYIVLLLTVPLGYCLDLINGLCPLHRASFQHDHPSKYKLAKCWLTSIMWQKPECVFITLFYLLTIFCPPPLPSASKWVRLHNINTCAGFSRIEIMLRRGRLRTCICVCMYKCIIYICMYIHYVDCKIIYY